MSRRGSERPLGAHNVRGAEGIPGRWANALVRTPPRRPSAQDDRPAAAPPYAKTTDRRPFRAMRRRPSGGRSAYAKTTVRLPFSSTRRSLCHFTARARAWHSTSRPIATSWSGVTS